MADPTQRREAPVCWINLKPLSSKCFQILFVSLKWPPPTSPPPWYWSRLCSDDMFSLPKEKTCAAAAALIWCLVFGRIKRVNKTETKPRRLCFPSQLTSTCSVPRSPPRRATTRGSVTEKTSTFNGDKLHLLNFSVENGTSEHQL